MESEEDLKIARRILKEHQHGIDRCVVKDSIDIAQAALHATEITLHELEQMQLSERIKAYQEWVEFMKKFMKDENNPSKEVVDYISFLEGLITSFEIRLRAAQRMITERSLQN